MNDLLKKLSNPEVIDTLRTVGRVAGGMKIEAYAVGGFVRDILVDRNTTDIDFVTIGSGSGIALAEAVANDLGGRPVHVYPNFGTAAIRLRGKRGVRPGLALEFVAARRESYRRNSRKPIVEDGTLADDLNRRDFTVNAMAMHLSDEHFGEIVDPFDGRADINRRRIRTPLAPARTFDDDPLRIVRAARFSAQLAFDIDQDTESAMQGCADRLRIVSQERITDEIQKIVDADIPSTGFKVLFRTRALGVIFPELVALNGVEEVAGHRHKDNFYHTLQVLDNLVALVGDRPSEETHWLRWAALLHDIAKPRTKRFVESAGWTFHGHEERGARMIPKLFNRLKLPGDERMRYVQTLVRLHHRPVALVDDVVTDSAVRRLLFDAGDTIDDLMKLVRADITSKNPRRVQRYLRAFDEVDRKLAEVEEKDRLRAFQPPVDGIEIMDTLNLEPSKLVGLLKDAIRDAILDGIIPNEHDAAFDFLMEIKDDVIASYKQMPAAGRKRDRSHRSKPE